MSPPKRPRRKRSGEFLADDLSRRHQKPRTPAQLARVFEDDTSCRLYLTALRWPKGFRCPHCHRRTRAEASNRALLRCLACGFVCTPVTGTVLERSPLPLSVWMRAIWELISHESGANPARLQKVLPASQTGLLGDWLAAMQSVFDRHACTRLHGLVEVAKVPIEVIGKNEHGRARARHAMVAIAVEVGAREDFGAIRVRSLPRVNPSSMMTFVRTSVKERSCVRTCNWHGYGKLRQHGYGHIVVRKPEEDETGMVLAQQVASLLKLWLWSTRAIELKQLDYYLSEFTFRYNARLVHPVGDRLAMFNELLQLALEQDGRATPARTVGRVERG